MGGAIPPFYYKPLFFGGGMTTICFANAYIPFLPCVFSLHGMY
jgi:hypothetical protein